MALPKIEPKEDIKLKIIYMNATLVNNRGHFATYARSIISSLNSNGFNTTCLANINVDNEIANDLNAYPTFKSINNDFISQDALCGWLENYSLQSKSVEEDLNNLTGINSDDIIICDCASPDQITGLGNWINKRFTPENSPTVVVILGWPTGTVVSSRDELGNPLDWKVISNNAILYRFSAKQINNRIAKKFRFVATCPTIAKAYSALIGVDVELMPNPQVATTKCRSRIGTKKPRIAFLGEQRENKGYRLVPDIVDKILKKYDNCELIIQNSWGLMDDVNNALLDLAKTNSRIQVKIGTLNSNEWSELLDSVDIVVLPYDLSTYSTCSSGIGVEAIANGIPQVVPQNSGMSDLLNLYENPGITFAKTTINDVTNAVGLALSNFDKIARKSNLASNLWSERNNQHKIANFLTKRV